MFLALQSVCGNVSGLPKQIVLRVGPTLDDLAAKSELYPSEVRAHVARAILDVLYNAETEAATFNRLAVATSA